MLFRAARIVRMPILEAGQYEGIHRPYRWHTARSGKTPGQECRDKEYVTSNSYARGFVSARPDTLARYHRGPPICMRRILNHLSPSFMIAIFAHFSFR